MTTQDMTSNESTTRDLDSHPGVSGWMRAAIAINEKLKGFVDFVGRYGGFLILPVVIITMIDAILRKIPLFQYWLVNNVSGVFGSTILQELEWHFHTGLFALVLGYGMIWNTHVRVDLVREHLAFRNKLRLEFWGVTLFMMPFCATIIYFCADWVHTSYAMNEISASQIGIPHRWAIKSVLLFGLITAFIAGIAVWLQTFVALMAPADARFDLSTLEWPEEDVKIEGKERLQIDYGLSDDVMDDVDEKANVKGV
ncbi:MAG: hypothetical protein RIM84_18035 [Alphaproteobacteria bacterium]